MVRCFKEILQCSRRILQQRGQVNHQMDRRRQHNFRLPHGRLCQDSSLSDKENCSEGLLQRIQERMQEGEADRRRIRTILQDEKGAETELLYSQAGAV